MPNIALATDSLSLRLKSPLWISASNILTVGSEPVISFSNRANHFSGFVPIHFYDICMGKIVENSGVVVFNHEYCEIFELNGNEKGMVLRMARMQDCHPIFF
jgi:hypothetical protein